MQPYWKGEAEMAQKANHTEAFRTRLYDATRSAGDAKYPAAEAQDRERTRTKTHTDEPNNAVPLPGKVQSSEAEVPIPSTPQESPVPQPPSTDTQVPEEPDSAGPQPQTPAPPWRNSNPPSDNHLQSSEPAVDPDEDVHDHLDSEHLYQEVNDDIEMV